MSYYSVMVIDRNGKPVLCSSFPKRKAAILCGIGAAIAARQKQSLGSHATYSAVERMMLWDGSKEFWAEIGADHIYLNWRSE